MNRYPLSNEDTIAAIATPPGSGGVAIIRVSGPKSSEILELIFKPGRENTNGKTMESHRLYYGHIINPASKGIADEVLCVAMWSPNSYTGEDVIEIHSHGGHLVPKRILEILFGLGIRPANPGEFSLRAFLNGKMDLAQAEAVSDIINARTEEGLKQAELQLEGALSQKIAAFKELTLDILAEIEAQVDFPEDEIDPIAKEVIASGINNLISGIHSLLDTYEEGRIIKHGVKTAILGKPNVGKSSLLNVLLMKERAIVSPLPGTTRDFIEESIDVRGIPLVLIDTAGIRKTYDEIEHEGVRLAKKKAEEAELLLVVLDGSEALDSDDVEVLQGAAGKNAIFILNKSDKGIKLTPVDLPFIVHPDRIVHTSAKLGTGTEELKDSIRGLLTGGNAHTDGSEVILTELRHKLALEKAAHGLTSFLKLLENGDSPEFLAIELRAALDSLGEITGEVTTEDILGRIFSKFCIGK
ncbi:MAG TPA: tRNA uridine-5-carboxymethylaminomethyl(34) synthesis GTPase MnmE [Thermodesulfobacteriota bacterium]|nr:tRNA uridine-5-carboxymethylaminomethyl(34) synthesis GTPase MnmE [Thermodesulfobacteriota bacterium]